MGVKQTPLYSVYPVDYRTILITSKRRPLPSTPYRGKERFGTTPEEDAESSNCSLGVHAKNAGLCMQVAVECGTGEPKLFRGALGIVLPWVRSSCRTPIFSDWTMYACPRAEAPSMPQHTLHILSSHLHTCEVVLL